MYSSSSKLNSTAMAFLYRQLIDIHFVLNGMSSMYCSSSKLKSANCCSVIISLQTSDVINGMSSMILR